ncbi:hypothetical protein B0H13DRAFT_2346897 [Mycena leptocephala]|nr:hypothetical protein B0H13DRAFT_2346897 [Mycena leptocephala]
MPPHPLSSRCTPAFFPTMCFTALIIALFATAAAAANINARCNPGKRDICITDPTNPLAGPLGPHSLPSAPLPPPVVRLALGMPACLPLGHTACPLHLRLASALSLSSMMCAPISHTAQLLARPPTPLLANQRRESTTLELSGTPARTTGRYGYNMESFFACAFALCRRIVGAPSTCIFFLARTINLTAFVYTVRAMFYGNIRCRGASCCYTDSDRDYLLFE